MLPVCLKLEPGSQGRPLLPAAPQAFLPDRLVLPRGCPSLCAAFSAGSWAAPSIQGGAEFAS